MNWQPIETAPKDGTKVLLWFTDWGVRGPNGGPDLPPDPRGHTYIGYWSAGDWIDDDGGGFYGRELTHWMPLPEPPNGPSA